MLLSLRELIEWVIRKDTELTGLGPVCGEAAALQKQQVWTDRNVFFFHFFIVLSFFKNFLINCGEKKGEQNNRITFIIKLQDINRNTLLENIPITFLIIKIR